MYIGFLSFIKPELRQKHHYQVCTSTLAVITGSEMKKKTNLHALRK